VYFSIRLSTILAAAQSAIGSLAALLSGTIVLSPVRELYRLVRSWMMVPSL
jgi:hypothetical protein